MQSIKIEQLNFRYLLVEYYKALNLSEKDLAILLLIYNVEMEQPTLITTDQLALKMSIDEKEIDTLLTVLFERGFLSYETINGLMVTSIKNTQNRVIDMFKKDIITSPSSILDIDDGSSDIFKLFAEKLRRNLTPFELDTIKSWINDGVKKEVIIDALNECTNNAKHLSIKAIDKIIVKHISSLDRKKEGFSVADEKHKKDVDDAIEIASYDWIHNG